MATSVMLANVLLALLIIMLTVGLSIARPSFDAAERQRVLPYSGFYDYKQGSTGTPGWTSPGYYVEPSSRDLDIGFTIDGDGDSGERAHSYTSGGPIRSGYVTREGYRDRYPEDDVNIGLFSDGSATSGSSRDLFYPSRDDDDGYPAVITQPLGHKVGEFKLRSDRGYQLSMHLPPSSVGDRPGVLKIDMKATLYKPIYY